MLEDYIRERLREKEILLMAHIVVGYPSIEDSFELVRTIVEAGVDLMELQIPFSEPIADGPVILKANQAAIADSIRVDDCFRFAQKVTSAFDIPFLFMTYYNILFKRGEERFKGILPLLRWQNGTRPCQGCLEFSGGYLGKRHNRCKR